MEAAKQCLQKESNLRAHFTFNPLHHLRDRFLHRKFIKSSQTFDKPMLFLMFWPVCIHLNYSLHPLCLHQCQTPGTQHLLTCIGHCIAISYSLIAIILGSHLDILMMPTLARHICIFSFELSIHDFAKPVHPISSGSVGQD